MSGRVVQLSSGTDSSQYNSSAATGMADRVVTIEPTPTCLLRGASLSVYGSAHAPPRLIESSRPLWQPSRGLFGPRYSPNNAQTTPPSYRG